MLERNPNRATPIAETGANGNQPRTLEPLKAHETPVAIGEIFSPAIDRFAAATLGRAIDAATPKKLKTAGTLFQK